MARHVPDALPGRGEGTPSAPAPPASGADTWEEDLEREREAEERRRSTDDLLDALTVALSVLHQGNSEVDRKRALRDSFSLARRGLGAAKALLLYAMPDQDAPQLQVLHSTGLEQEQLDACREMRSCEGVSPSVIRQALDTREVVYIPNAQAREDAQATASLAGGTHSVLCAPVIEPLTGTALAVLYFQNHGLSRSFRPVHHNWLTSYATALSHGFGMHLMTERRLAEIEENQRRLARAGDPPEVVGEGEGTRNLRTLLHETFIPEVVDRHGKPILILGPSGTGKDLIARYLHYYSSQRGRNPYIACNCAGLRAGEMTKSLLFGHVRGSFTGAIRDSPGMFRDANKGVLFLDEIGELPPDGQAELLRVLQDSRVTPLGSNQSFAVDIQLVVATNRDLEAEVKAGRFREDLYYRIAVHTIRLQPLAHPSRRGDIRPMLAYFLAAQERASKKRTGGLTHEALRALLAYTWPGNVRELINVCTVLVTYTRPGAMIDVVDIATHRPEVLDPASRRADADLVEVDPEMSYKEGFELWEREFIRARIDHCGGNLTRAAKSLDMGYSTLMRKLQAERAREAKKVEGDA